jgi:hypothetical protein
MIVKRNKDEIKEKNNKIKKKKRGRTSTLLFI